MSRGKLIILAIATVATLMGGYAWWHQLKQGDQIHQYWGAEPTWLIRHARTVELLELDHRTPEGSDDSLAIGNASMSIVGRRDLSDARGLVHARHALIIDASFTFDAASADRPEWDFALQFREGERHATVVFDPSRRRAVMIESMREVGVGPSIESIQEYLARFRQPRS